MARIVAGAADGGAAEQAHCLGEHATIGARDHPVGDAGLLVVVDQRIAHLLGDLADAHAHHVQPVFRGRGYGLFERDRRLGSQQHQEQGRPASHRSIRGWKDGVYQIPRGSCYNAAAAMLVLGAAIRHTFPVRTTPCGRVPGRVFRLGRRRRNRPPETLRHPGPRTGIGPLESQRGALHRRSKGAAPPPGRVLLNLSGHKTEGGQPCWRSAVQVA